MTKGTISLLVIFKRIPKQQILGLIPDNSGVLLETSRFSEPKLPCKEQMPQAAPASRRDPDGEDVVYLRTDDVVCFLASSLVDRFSAEGGRRGFLSACGFGSRNCYIDQVPKDEPANLSHCSFTVENALSVRALHEIVASNNVISSTSRRTLLYGHAILLKHTTSQKYLSCLSTSPHKDKLAFDVGLGDRPEDESCWFTVHPSSKQRSEGEKIRACDDIILVSVSSERFLHVDGDSIQVQVSFQQSIWTVLPVCSGKLQPALKGYLHGGAVIRFFHRHDNLCLTSSRDSSGQLFVRFEGGSMNKHAKSLWLVETLRTRWGHGFIQWGQPVRIKNLVSGKYLTLNETKVMSLEPEPTLEASVFVLTQSENDNVEFDEAKDYGMGEPCIRVGDSVVYVRHKSQPLWLGHHAAESRRRKRRKRVIQEMAFGMGVWHMDYGFTLTKAGGEEHRAADVMRISTRVMKSFRQCVIRLERQEEVDEELQEMTDTEAVQEELLLYFAESDATSGQDCRQNHNKILKMRQDLFREQGMIGLLLEITELLSQVCNRGEIRPGEHLLDVVVNMYTLLAAVIRGNRVNCSQFAHAKCLEWLFKRLCSSARKAAKGTLEVLHCVLTASPEALSMITDAHIKSLVVYLEKNGRDETVLDVLSALCEWNGVAVRDNQNRIQTHLLPKKGVLLQTHLIDHIETCRANVFVGIRQGAASYPQWYFEMAVVSTPKVKDKSTFLRVGWANAEGFKPFFGAGGMHLPGSIGDDYSSVGFDGQRIWVGGHSIDCTEKPERNRLVKQAMSVQSTDWSPRQNLKLDIDDSSQSALQCLKRGDTVGCLLDLQNHTVKFMLNGKDLSSSVIDFDVSGMFCPVVSMSAGIKCSLRFGRNFGLLSHPPPSDYSAVFEAIVSDAVSVERCVSIGNIVQGEIEGLPALMDYSGYVPAPVDTTSVEMPSCVEVIRDDLAENIHEVWAVNKIKEGFTYGPTRDDDLKHNPCLKSFSDLSDGEKDYDIEMAFQTIRTLLALGYQIGIESTRNKLIPKLQLDRKKYTMSNGYRPQPLDLSAVPKLPAHLDKLVDLLAKNAHDVWARSRISEEWTFGRAKDGDHKRNPLLVPFEKLHDKAKESNRCTAFESVRTILAFGYTLQPPYREEQSVHELSRELSTAEYSCRTYRCQYTSAVSTGKWYYEVSMLTNGYVRVGWASPKFQAGEVLGSDHWSYAFDGYLARKWHEESETFGRTWSVGDIVGCLLDLKEKKMEFCLNGNMLTDQLGVSVAFDNFPAEAFVPAITLGMGQRAKINLGNDLSTLHYYNHVGLQKGYEPFCNNMTKTVPVWYSRNLPEFQDITSSHPRLCCERVPFLSNHGSRMSGRALKLQRKSVDPNTSPQWEYVRLNMCVPCGQAGTSHLSQHGFDTAVVGLDSESDLEENEDATPVGQYSFSVQIFPGQSLSDIEVGWVTAGFRSPSLPAMNGYRRADRCATLKKQKHDKVLPGSNVRDSDMRMSLMRDKLELKVKESYTCKVSSLCSVANRPMSRDLVIDCILDTNECVASFRVNGRQGSSLQAMKVIPGTVLFPACFILSSGQQLAQFQFTPAEGCEPLAAAIMSTVSGCSVHQCPPRFQLQSLEECSWVRMPDQSVQPLTITKESDGAQSVTCRQTANSVIAILPEQEKAMDLLELVEHPSLLSFHAHSLSLFSAMCSRGNTCAAKKLKKMVCTDELMWCTTAEALPGPLKHGYYNLLIALHLETYASARELVKKEFIIPLSDDDCPLPKRARNLSLSLMEHDLAKHLCYSVMNPEGDSICLQHSYAELSFPAGKLKCHAMRQIDDGLKQSAMYRRDLDDQARVDLFVPLLKLIDRLLVIGFLTPDDLQHLLEILDPETFAVNRSTETEGWKHGLIALAAQEPIKLQITYVLQHLCDIQVRRKVESLVEFGKDFVKDLQEDQKQRLTAIKQSSQYSPSTTAKKTREFRMSPSEQMDLLLDMFHGEGEGESESNLAGRLHDLHEFLVTRCLLPADNNSCEENKPDHQSWSGKLVGKLKGWKDAVVERLTKHHQLQYTQVLRSFIARTMMNWAKQEIKDPQLTREVFCLLHRQYDGVGEVFRGLTKAYVVKDTGVQDIVALMDSLGQILSLLCVRMGPAEEEILRVGLKNVSMSALFFQHPDLMRSLGVHKAVINILKNILGASSGSMFGRRPSRLSSMEARAKKVSPLTIAACCKFLMTFCRTSRQNQRAIFEHLEFLLRHSGRAATHIKGSSPLSVAIAAVRDSQELALSLQESHIESVVGLLANTAVPSIVSVTAMDSPWCAPASKRMIRSESSLSFEEWSPKDCECFLDFLRHIVWVNGQTVVENASLVVRSLIRRPECLGPALESDGKGMLQVLEEANEEAEIYFRKHLPRLSEVAEEEQESLLNPHVEDFYMGSGQFSPILEERNGGGTENENSKTRVRFAKDDVTLGHETPVTDELPAFAGLSIKNLQQLPDPDRQSTRDSTPNNGDQMTPLSPKPGMDFFFMRSNRDSITGSEYTEELMSLEMSMETFAQKPALKKGTKYHEYEVPMITRNDTDDSLTTEQGTQEEDRGMNTLSFYASLIDLLGRCASSKCCNRVQSSQTKNQLDAGARLHSILKSLIPLDDLLGFLKIPFKLLFHGFSVRFVGIGPQHKAAVLLFLDRVYGAGDESVLVSLLEQSFLPDIRKATSLGMMADVHQDCTILLNRYIFTSVLPLLTTHAQIFRGQTKHTAVIDALLHTCYQLSRSQQLTTRQRQKVSDFLVVLTHELNPSMMQRLMRKLVRDVKNCSDNAVLALRVIQQHYVHFKKYYGVPGQGATVYGLANSEEKHMTMTTFAILIDTLHKRASDGGELFSTALDCLFAVACALSPDYTLHRDVYNRLNMASGEHRSPSPSPGPSPRPELSEDLKLYVEHYAEHCHDHWAHELMCSGWTEGSLYSECHRCHPSIKPFTQLQESQKELYRKEAIVCIDAMFQWGWEVVYEDPALTVAPAKQPSLTKTNSSSSLDGSESVYNPQAADLTNVVLPQELETLGERLAEFLCESSICSRPSTSTFQEGHLAVSTEPALARYDMLLEKDKVTYRDSAQRVLKFLLVCGCKIRRAEDIEAVKHLHASQVLDRRFAYWLLQWVIQYLEQVANDLNHGLEVNRSLFGPKVIVPLITSYLETHHQYFSSAGSHKGRTLASREEKALIIKLFCNAVSSFREHLQYFLERNLIPNARQYLMYLIKALDIKFMCEYVSPDVETEWKHFFETAAGDLAKYPSGDMETYLFEILIPMLSQFYYHVSEQHGHKLINEYLLSAELMVSRLHRLGRTPNLRDVTFYSVIGDALGSMAVAMPVAFLETLSVVPGMPRLGLLLEELEEVDVKLSSDQEVNLQTSDLLAVTQGINDIPTSLLVGVPLLCNYLSEWWVKGPSALCLRGGTKHASCVNSDLVDTVLGHILSIASSQFHCRKSAWIVKLTLYALPLIPCSTITLLRGHFLPLIEGISNSAQTLLHLGETLEDHKNLLEGEARLVQHYKMLVRDLTSVMPLLLSFISLHKSELQGSEKALAMELFSRVGVIFRCWFKSPHFRREYQALLLTSQSTSDGHSTVSRAKSVGQIIAGAVLSAWIPGLKSECADDISKSSEMNPLAQCLKRLLPICMDSLTSNEQSLVQEGLGLMLQSSTEEEMVSYIEVALHGPKRVQGWKSAVSMRNHQDTVKQDKQRDKICDIVQILHHLHHIENPVQSKHSVWKRIVSEQKKRAVMRCFLMVPLYKLPVHRAINLFLQSYRGMWLKDDIKHHAILMDHLTKIQPPKDFAASGNTTQVVPPQSPRKIGSRVVIAKQLHQLAVVSSASREFVDPLSQLIQYFTRMAASEQMLADDMLYVSYGEIMSQSCGADEADEFDEHDTEKSFQQQEREKRFLLKEQNSLSTRGAAQMVIMLLSECSGQVTPVTLQTLQLGISLLRGGNTSVQAMMLEYLISKCDVGFFNSMSALIATCSVLDLDAYERRNRAEILGLSKEDAEGIKAMSDSPFTVSLFRFLQLLCEGHNDAFQNMLRTQAGNTTTVNIVICTVDYLLRLQESISDFYWHYSARDMIDSQGRESLSNAIRVAKQVCRTLTEYVQGPCVENQLALAHSRLWDTVGGFFHVFAKIMNRLSQDVSQLELLRELFKLQKELVILLLSLLEGNECFLVIGKQMVDTLEESESHLEEILRFFDMFIRLNDIITSTAFMEFDTNQDGWISPKEFERAMLAQSIYNKTEIKYLMSCADVNKDGKLDYMEFTERFFVPAEDIGFCYAVLMTNLCEHLPNDARLRRFRETWKDLLSHFNQSLGRIEILGQSGRVERLYFGVKTSQRDQWMEPQIQFSKQAFLHSVNRASHKEKIEEFVGFCEDTIFEMEHSASISDCDQQQRLLRAERHMEIHQASSDGAYWQRAHLYQEPVFSISGLIEQTGVWAWIKFLLCLPLVFSVMFGRSIWKRSRNWFLNIPGEKLLIGEDPAGDHSQTVASNTDNTSVKPTDGSTVRHRGLRKSASVPVRSPLSKDRHRLLSDSEKDFNASRLKASQKSSTLDAQDSSGRTVPQSPSLPVPVTPQLNLPIRPAKIKVEVVGADHISSAINGIAPSCHSPPLRLQVKPDFGRSVSDPTGRSAEDETQWRRASLRRQSSGLDMTFPVGFLVSDVTKKRPEIIKRESSDEPDGSATASINVPVPTRQFSHQRSAALIAMRHRQSVASFVLNQTAQSVNTGVPQQSRQGSMSKERPVRSLNKSTFSVEDEPMGDQGKPYIPKVAIARRKFLAMFSRSYYGAKKVALAVVFAINIILLSYKAISSTDNYDVLMLEEDPSYLLLLLNLLSSLHFAASVSVLIGYIHLKIPLVIFKYEKYIARELEFQGTWIARPPESYFGYWHLLVIRSWNFPVNYWDKMVKQRVMNRYAPTVGQKTAMKILNLEEEPVECLTARSRFSFLRRFDWRYHLWTLGVVFTDKAFLYNLIYLVFSALGNWNHFFFCVHLLDIVMGFNLLRTVLQSVTHNWKQLLLTLMMTVVVVYIYTVLAFNFFRKFYVREVNQGVRDAKCQDMMTCFVFHLHRGLRAGGGIGDEIEDAYGDDYESFRIIFDITFFFVVIVILLAIIQGLIIDSFGELRDRAEDVQMEMETKCFVCGISKEQFDKTPHGFELHVTQEHNMANYMFFLMYLINKPETEYTGQESYVWKLYQERSWDFFPVGDCFRFRQERLLDSTKKQTSNSNE